MGKILKNLMGQEGLSLCEMIMLAKKVVPINWEACEDVREGNAKGYGKTEYFYHYYGEIDDLTVYLSKDCGGFFSSLAIKIMDGDIPVGNSRRIRKKHNSELSDLCLCVGSIVENKEREKYALKVSEREAKQKTLDKRLISRLNDIRETYF